MSAHNPSASYFEMIAGQWDDLRSSYFGEALREAAIAHAYLRPEMVVADVGTGTGFIAAGLAPRVSKVYALDGSPAMLAQARKNLAAFNNVELLPADGAALPLPDASLDAVFANMYLHHCPDPLAALREMVRLLRPGGRLVLSDLDAHTHSWMKVEMADVWLGFGRDQLRDWFREAGLVNVLVSSSGQTCCAEANSKEAGEAKIGVFVASGTRRVAAREAVSAHYAAHAQRASSCRGDAACATSAEGACCGADGSPCCGDEKAAELTWGAGYSAAEVAQAPAEAQEISLGCGNPLAMAALRPGEVVLDIGSGGGLDAFLAARRVMPHGKVIGVDMTPAMLARARETAGRNGIANVEFREGQAEQLPLEDGSVDVVISNCVINLVEDKARAFEEAFRVLKPGGRLEISDVVTAASLLPHERMDSDSWSACLGGALPEQEYLDLVAQAGFGNIRTRRSTGQGIQSDAPAYSLIVSATRQPPEGCSGDCAC